MPNTVLCLGYFAILVDFFSTKQYPGSLSYRSSPRVKMFFPQATYDVNRVVETTLMSSKKYSDAQELAD